MILRSTEQRDVDSIFQYFLEAYPKEVATVMVVLDVEYLEQFIPKEDQVEEAPAQ